MHDKGSYMFLAPRDVLFLYASKNHYESRELNFASKLNGVPLAEPHEWTLEVGFKRRMMQKGSNWCFTRSEIGGKILLYDCQELSGFPRP